MREKIEPLVKSLHCTQRVRISIGHRLVANFKARVADVKNVDIEVLKRPEIIKEIRESYGSISIGVAETLKNRKFPGDHIITSETEYEFTKMYFELEKLEKSITKELKVWVEEHPLWDAWLAKVPGVGPAMAGVLLSEIDINRAKYPSSLWQLAGLDVAKDGRGRQKFREHCVKTEDGRLRRVYNAFLKSKLMGVQAEVFIKKKSPYAEIYYDYKHRLQNSPKFKKNSKMHIHLMSCRYMIKIFLADLFYAWKTLEGQKDLPEMYSSEKLGIEHSSDYPGFKLGKSSLPGIDYKTDVGRVGPTVE